MDDKWLVGYTDGVNDMINGIYDYLVDNQPEFDGGKFRIDCPHIVAKMLKDRQKGTDK